MLNTNEIFQNVANKTFYVSFFFRPEERYFELYLPVLLEEYSEPFKNKAKDLIKVSRNNKQIFQVQKYKLVDFFHTNMHNSSKCPDHHLVLSCWLEASI